MDTEEEKQNYLRENILEKGYEAEDFVTYLTSKKGDEGVDLGNWSLNELKSVVQEYLLTHQKPNAQIENNYQPTSQLQTNYQQNNSIQNMNFNMNNNVNDFNNMNTPMNNNLINNNNFSNPEMQNNMNQNIIQNQLQNDNESDMKTDVYGITNLDTILCSINEKSELSKYENIQIGVSLGEKKEGKLFSKSYMTYIITTSPLNLKVHRRYSDFEWLRQILINFYSSSVIPPIPKKGKIGSDKFSEAFLIKRARTLEKFLNLLMEDPVIKVSQIVYDFLSIEEEGKFSKSKKTYNNFKLSQNLRDFKSPSGKLDIGINEEREIFFQNIKDNAELNQGLLSKLNNNLKLLNHEMTLIAELMDEISKNCQDLCLNSVKYSDSNEVKITYYQLNDMFKYWSNAFKKQSTIININIREYFKYTKNTYRSMKELINTVDNYKQNYYKSKRNLVTKKEELFKKSDISKWDLGPNQNISITNLLRDKNIALPKMLCNETNNVINMKQIYGYYLNRAISEFERIRKLITFGHRENMTVNSKEQIEIISELFKNMSEIAMDSPKYDINNIEKEITEQIASKEFESNISKN